MKLIIIYGQPGTGKLTVAKELSKITGYKLFHNHLTVDLVSSVFPFGTKAYSDLVEDIRLKLLFSAAKSGVDGMIFTIVYGIETYGTKRTDDEFIKKIIRGLKKHRSQVIFVKLTCNDTELSKRIKQPSRKKFKKLSTFDALKSIRNSYDLDATIPFVKTKVIDNTKLSPKKVAGVIKKLI